MTTTEEMTLTELLQRIQRGDIPLDATARVTFDMPGSGRAPDSEAALALFDQWDAEDALRSPQEIEEEKRLFAQFETQVNETRTALGMRTL